MHPPLCATAAFRKDAVLALQEVVIRDARFEDAGGSLGLMLRLTSERGIVSARVTDLGALFDLVGQLGCAHPREMVGKRAVAHFLGNRLVGLSP